MRWYQVNATGHFGYPQPEDSYASVVYEIHCERYGIHGAQCAPFRFRSEPKARHSQFLQLNWVFDELFVRREVATKFKEAGISGGAFGPAIHHKTHRCLETVQQLIIGFVLSDALETEGLQTVTCKPNNEEPTWHGGGPLRYPPDYPYCGRVKYHWPKVLRLRRQPFTAAPDVVRSSEWFGSGGAADRAILVSERVVEVTEKNGWRGLQFRLVEFTD